MSSPFPGMDPYLETHWEDVHHRLVLYSCDRLQAQLPADLRARVEERVFVESGSQLVRQTRPDVQVVYSAPTPLPTVLREGGATAAEPIVFEMHELSIAEGYIVLRERGAARFLSPTNKRAGTGQEKYLEQQGEVLQSDASLGEIDLVRAGQRVLTLPTEEIPVQYRNDYLACVSPGWKRSRRELYPLPLRQRLPVLPIPLRQEDAPVQLDLQAVVDQVYAAGRYDDLDYGTELDPPLSGEEAAWANQLLIGTARRRG